MTKQEFNDYVEETLREIKDVLIVKGDEYIRGGNPFHNFDEGARITSEYRERVIDGFKLKHEISINDMVNDIEKGDIPNRGIVDEKFNDVLVYTIIKKISIIDRINTDLPF